MSVSRGDVVLVDYPFSDRMGSKVRPALIVQVSLAPAPAAARRRAGATDSLNHRITDTILAGISRSTHRASITQLFVDVSTTEGRRTGLRQNSMIQCENLLTFDQRLIIAKIGELSATLIRQAERCLKAAIELP